MYHDLGSRKCRDVVVHVTLTLRLFGNLTYIATITRVHQDVGFIVGDDDGCNGGSVILPLAQWTFDPIETIGAAPNRPLIGTTCAISELSEVSAVAYLHELTPTLIALDPARCWADLSMNVLRSHNSGNFFFLVPRDVIVASAAAGLALGLTVQDNHSDDGRP